MHEEGNGTPAGKEPDAAHADALSGASISRGGFVKAVGGIALATALGGAGAGVAGATPRASRAARRNFQGKTINMIAWPGHGDKFLVGPFEKATGARVRVKEYNDGDEMLALVLQSKPGTYDVIMHDPEVILKFGATGALMDLDPDEFPAANRDFFPRYRPSGKFPVHWFGNKMKAVAWSYNFTSLSWNTRYITDAEASSYSIVWEPKVDQKVGWSHWWLASMPVVVLYVGAQERWWKPGEQDPFRITPSQFKTVKDFLFNAPTTARGFYGIGDTTTALANEDIWLTPGGGGAISYALTQQGKPIKSYPPKEGAVQYTESLSISKDSKNVEGAKQLINYLISPEGGARKALLPSYQGIPVSAASWRWIAKNRPKWARLLGTNLNAKINALTPHKQGRIVYRRLPNDTELWTKTWEEYKNKVS